MIGKDNTITIVIIAILCFIAGYFIGINVVNKSKLIRKQAYCEKVFGEVTCIDTLIHISKPYKFDKGVKDGW